MKLYSPKDFFSLNESKFDKVFDTEDAVFDIFAEEEEGKVFTAYVDEDLGEVNCRVTSSTWDDGTPVTKQLDRSNNVMFEIPSGEYKGVENSLYYYLKIKDKWIRLSKSEYETPPFDM